MRSTVILGALGLSLSLGSAAAPGLHAEGSAGETAALFAPVAEVLLHARCVNCHPATATPRQGDVRRLHTPRVVRGPDGHGIGQRCSTCHGEANNLVSGVPGSREWSLAPASMAWEGLGAGDVCRRLLDRSANGDRDLAALAHHMAEDPRVDWAWQPGPGREVPPISKSAFLTAFSVWAARGAVCPP